MAERILIIDSEYVFDRADSIIHHVDCDFLTGPVEAVSSKLVAATAERLAAHKQLGLRNNGGGELGLCRKCQPWTASHPGAVVRQPQARRIAS